MPDNTLNQVLASLIAGGARNLGKRTLESQVPIFGVPGMAALAGIIRVNQNAGPLQQAGQVMSQSPSPMQAGAAIPQGMDFSGMINGLTGGSGNAMAATPEEDPNAIVADETNKAVRKFLQKNAEQLLASGVAPEQILATTAGYGVRKDMAQGKPSEPSETPQGQDQGMQPQGGEGQAQLQPQGAQFQQLKQILGGLGRFVGMDFSRGLLSQGGTNPETGDYEQPSALFGLVTPSASDKYRQQAAYSDQPSVKRRQLEEETVAKASLLGGEKYVTNRDEFFKSALQKKEMSGETSRLYNYAVEADEAITDLLGILKQKPEALREIATPNNRLGKRVRDRLNQVRAALTPARAGANLSNQEKALVESLIPARGLAALAEDPRDAIFKLESLQRASRRISQGIKPNEGRTREIQFLLKQGFSRDEIYEEFRRRGEV